jgi:hypothetical protein
MIVNLSGQRPDAAPAAQRSGNGHASPARAPSDARALAVRSQPAQVFDANDDGVVENWSYMHGGDSFATISPPPSGSDPARPRTNATNGAAGTHPAPTHAGGHAGTAAAVHHAHDAYRRDGLANAPAAKPAPAPAPAAQPAPTVPRPGTHPALPSTPS